MGQKFVYYHPEWNTHIYKPSAWVDEMGLICTSSVHLRLRKHISSFNVTWKYCHCPSGLVKAVNDPWTLYVRKGI